VSGEVGRISNVAPTTITGSVAAQNKLQLLPTQIISALKIPTNKSVAKKKVWYRHLLAEHSLIRAITMLVTPAICTRTDTQTMTASLFNHIMNARQFHPETLVVQQLPDIG
jgi:hypothetical protein